MAILDGLNAEQRRAAEAVRGPVCVLAGAGSGKTTTITRRIAWQVESGAFPPSELLAVTFTDKAAGEMRGRLAALGVAGVQARTFHSAALALLRRYAPAQVGRIVASKALVLRQIGNALPKPYRFRPAVDLATEIERAKNGRVTPERYLDGLGEHTPPIPPDLMVRVYTEYERRKVESGAMDFEDVLERAVRTMETDAPALTDVQERYRAFTVDEYQDVNLLQQSLLDLWLGEREDLCVVGDDYQSIYAFTGASPRWLLGVTERFPNAVVARLEENYRSSQQVLALANKLVPRLGGVEKVLRAVNADGPDPEVRGFATAEAEAAWISERIRGLALPLAHVAILARTNARLADFEEVLHDAGIAFQGSSLLAREAARRIVKQLSREAGATGVRARVRGLAKDAGWTETPPDKLGERELTRQADLARLVRLAAELDDGELTVGAFVEELERRFSSGGEHAQGVHLLTLHRSKGLEWDAVFLPRLDDKELPSRMARTPDEVQEERRLLYVGMTRAKCFLHVSWSKRPSAFLTEIGIASRAPGVATAAGPKREWSAPAQAIREWRLERARSEGVPAYVVFPDRTIEEIVRLAPRTPSELAAVPGLGPARLERFGGELLRIVRGAIEASPAAAPPSKSDANANANANANAGLYHALASWRRAQAEREDVPPFHVFGNKTLDAIALARPASTDELLAVPGVGPAKLDRYGAEVLDVIAAA